MKIVVACDSYKGCMSAKEVVSTIEKGIKKANVQHEVFGFPMADGGEGTADILSGALKAKKVEVDTVDAYGQPIKASYGFDGQRAIMDVATCIGLNMTPRHLRNPMVASSKGVGLMMADAIKRGCKEIIIGLGGSATNDGGMGILHSFGVRFYDWKGRQLAANVYSLRRIETIDISKFSWDNRVKLTVICDVKNPLLGKKGATYTFGKQKGIFLNQMEEVDRWMAHYAKKIQSIFKTDITSMPGSGAAGGIGAILLGIFNAKMENGIEYMIKLSGMEQVVQTCDLVITGEGQSDAQTLYGKVPYGILQVAKKYRKPTLCLSGAVSRGYQELYEAGMIGVFATADRAMTFQQALAHGPEKLEALAYSIIKYTDGILGGIKENGEESNEVFK